MTVKKQRNFPTRAFGAEPGIPDIPSLAGWVAERKGIAGDLTSYLLAQSIAPQQEAGITSPCAGGVFYRGRILESLLSLDQQAVVGEIGVKPDAVIADAAESAAVTKGVTIAMPAPHLLGITDQYYHDEDEWSDAITSAYRSLMRSMRDAGCGGHVLICDRIDEAELSALAGRKAFFFHPSPKREDLESLLECQRVVAVPNQDIGMALSLMDEFEITGLVVLDPDSAGIQSVLLREDPEKIAIGGYCTADCPAYWHSLVKSAVYRL